MLVDSYQLQNELRAFSRRTLLKSCLAVGAGVSTLGVIGCSGPAKESMPFLSQEDAHVIMHLANNMFPDDDRLLSIHEVSIAKNVSKLIGMLNESVRSDVIAAIKLFEYGALVLGWHLSRFSKLTGEDAIAYCNQWQNGSELQRGILTVLKKLIYTAYWQDSNTWASVSFDGPVSEKWQLEKLGNTAMPTVG